MATKLKEKPLKLSKADRDKTKYFITMSGLYFSRSTDGITEEPYELKFIMTHKQTETLIPQAFFKHDREVQTVMKSKYPNFLGRFSTFHVVKAECERPELLADNIHLLNRLELEEYVEDNDLPIEVQLHDDAEQLRQAIKDYKKDKEGFEKQQELLKKRRAPILNHRKVIGQVASADELLKLNEIISPKTRKRQVEVKDYEEDVKKYDDEEDDEDEDDSEV